MSTPEEEGRRRIVVGANEAGMRLDRFLAAHMPGMSRARLQALIAAGEVRLGGATIGEPAHRVKPGETFEVSLPAPAPARPEAQDIPLAVVYEDAHLIVIDKPAGLVVHPAAGNADRTLVNALLAHCGASLSGIGGEKRPGIVHRLDKDTSGLIVAAKDDRSHVGLAAQFATHSIERAYQAVVWGWPQPAAGTITGAIGRSPRDRKKMALLAQGGKAAVTHYRTLRRFGDHGGLAVDQIASLVECRLETGRTHQIRVHFASRGHPLVGDPVYGSGLERLRRLAAARGVPLPIARQALHAGRLGFVHPITGERLCFESLIPKDFRMLLDFLERL